MLTRKKKIIGSLLTAMFSIVMHAAEDTQNTVAAAAEQIPNAASSQPSLLMLILWILLAILSIAVVICIYIWFSNRFKDAEQHVDKKINQLTSNIRSSISSAMSPASKSLSVDSLVSTMEKCIRETRDMEEKLDSLLSMAPKFSEMNEQMKKLIDERPALVNLSIDTAVELVKQCQMDGLSTAAQVMEAASVFKQCKELRFTSVAEIAESKKYYDARASHAEAMNESRQKLHHLEEEKATLCRELDLLKGKQTSVNEEVVRVTQNNETLSAENAELVRNLAQANAERERLSLAMKTLCPDEVEIDSLIGLLKDTSPVLRAETLVSVVQLYWFSQLSRNTPNKIKAAFTKFDETLYELFADEQELLQSIRQTIRPFINAEVFKETSYEVSWPMLNTSASEHEDHYNRENDEGNRICRVRSAVIVYDGHIESVARIYTSL